jgi:superfamily II DNA or RNA helicase
MADFGLPMPARNFSDLEKEMLLYDAAEQGHLHDHLEEKFPANAEQKTVYDAVMRAVRDPSEESRFFFISGVAGAGKTLMANKIAAKLRSRGHIVQICASTTLAAQLYKNALTAHSLFKFPVLDVDAAETDAPPTCR